MRHVISPVAVITSADGAQRKGLTATAICSATTEPPSMLVCLNRASDILKLIDSSGNFAVNFLSNAQSSLARAFSSRDGADTSRLWAEEWTTLRTGAPVLRDAVGVFDCRVSSSTRCGRHQILLGRVAAISHTGDSPLLYGDGFFRRLAQE